MDEYKENNGSLRDQMKKLHNEWRGEVKYDEALSAENARYWKSNKRKNQCDSIDTEKENLRLELQKMNFQLDATKMDFAENVSMLQNKICEIRHQHSMDSDLKNKEIQSIKRELQKQKSKLLMSQKISAEREKALCCMTDSVNSIKEEHKRTSLSLLELESEYEQLTQQSNKLTQKLRIFKILKEENLELELKRDQLVSKQLLVSKELGALKQEYCSLQMEYEGRGEVIAQLRMQSAESESKFLRAKDAATLQISAANAAILIAQTQNIKLEARTARMTIEAAAKEAVAEKQLDRLKCSVSMFKDKYVSAKDHIVRNKEKLKECARMIRNSKQQIRTMKTQLAKSHSNSVVGDYILNVVRKLVRIKGLLHQVYIAIGIKNHIWTIKESQYQLQYNTCCQEINTLRAEGSLSSTKYMSLQDEHYELQSCMNRLTIEKERLERKARAEIKLTAFLKAAELKKQFMKQLNQVSMELEAKSIYLANENATLKYHICKLDKEIWGKYRVNLDRKAIGLLISSMEQYWVGISYNSAMYNQQKLQEVETMKMQFRFLENKLRYLESHTTCITSTLLFSQHKMSQMKSLSVYWFNIAVLLLSRFIQFRKQSNREYSDLRNAGEILICKVLDLRLSNTVDSRSVSSYNTAVEEDELCCVHQILYDEQIEICQSLEFDLKTEHNKYLHLRTRFENEVDQNQFLNHTADLLKIKNRELNQDLEIRVKNHQVEQKMMELHVQNDVLENQLNSERRLSKQHSQSLCELHSQVRLLEVEIASLSEDARTATETIFALSSTLSRKQECIIKQKQELAEYRSNSSLVDFETKFKNANSQLLDREKLILYLQRQLAESELVFKEQAAASDLRIKKHEQEGLEKALERSLSESKNRELAKTHCSLLEKLRDSDLQISAYKAEELQTSNRLRKSRAFSKWLKCVNFSLKTDLKQTTSMLAQAQNELLVTTTDESKLRSEIVCMQTNLIEKQKQIDSLKMQVENQLLEFHETMEEAKLGNQREEISLDGQNKLLKQDNLKLQMDLRMCTKKLLENQIANKMSEAKGKYLEDQKNALQEEYTSIQSILGEKEIQLQILQRELHTLEMKNNAKENESKQILITLQADIKSREILLKEGIQILENKEQFLIKRESQQLKREMLKADIKKVKDVPLSDMMAETKILNVQMRSRENAYNVLKQTYDKTKADLNQVAEEKQVLLMFVQRLSMEI